MSLPCDCMTGSFATARRYWIVRLFDRPTRGRSVYNVSNPLHTFQTFDLYYNMVLPYFIPSMRHAFDFR